MNPSKEVGEASGEETGIEETMEGVAAMVDAMTSAVEAVEAMVTAVEMREWLEVGRAETERVTAVHFFSRALAYKEERPVDEEGNVSVLQVFPLYWPGFLPGLAQCLADCLNRHNSKAIQSDAMYSLKHIVCLRRLEGEPFNELIKYGLASLHLFRLARESNCTEIRDQALWLLGWRSRFGYHDWNLDFVPLTINLISNYAAIQEPTDADLFSLNNAIEALTHVARHKPRYRYWIRTNISAPLLHDILPVLISLFHEPGKRKSVQVQAGGLLAAFAGDEENTKSILGSGLIEMAVEMLRVGKESSAVLFEALEVIYHVRREGWRKMLDMGVLDVIHQVLKRPNDSFKREDCIFGTRTCALETLWDKVLKFMYRYEANILTAVLNQEGLMELVMERGLGMKGSLAANRYRRHTMSYLLSAWQLNPAQIRQLMWKPPFFQLLSLLLNDNYYDKTDVESSHRLHGNLSLLKACLEVPGSETEVRLRRRLIDSTGITDVLRLIRITYYPPMYSGDDCANRARHILDTYLNNPLPPPLPTKLPFIIYTRNVPS